jgi:hypothetical protein
MDKNLAVNLEDIFRNHAEFGYIYLSHGTSNSDNYDSIRGTGKVVVLSNPFPIKVLLKQVSAYSKSLQSEGISESEALDIIIKEKDLLIVRAARQIKIKDVIYYTSYDMVGSKFNYVIQSHGFVKVRIYKRNK